MWYLCTFRISSSIISSHLTCWGGSGPLHLPWVRVEVAGLQSCQWLFICSPHNSTLHAAHTHTHTERERRGGEVIKAPFHFSSRLCPKTRPPSLQGCSPSPLNCISCCSYFWPTVSLCSLSPLLFLWSWPFCFSFWLGPWYAGTKMRSVSVHVEHRACNK